MLFSQRTGFISIADYLESELNRDIKHEYLDGQIYAMAGASKNHQRIIIEYGECVRWTFTKYAL